MGFHFSCQDIKVQSLSKANWIGNLWHCLVDRERSRSLTAVCVGVSDSQTSCKTERTQLLQSSICWTSSRAAWGFQGCLCYCVHGQVTARQLLDEVITRHFLLISIVMLSTYLTVSKCWAFPRRPWDHIAVLTLNQQNEDELILTLHSSRVDHCIFPAVQQTA